MIRIKFEEPDTLIWRRWIRDCKKAAANLKDNWKWGQPFEIDSVYRRKSIKETVYFAKKGPFSGKCAYCESYIADFQHGDMEHFRPKKGITDENGAPVFVNSPGGVRLEHPGYFWRAYDYRNLLPSCITCNQPGQNGIGKHNRFPLSLPPEHATNEDEIAGERPLLLNPIDPKDEDPEDHLGVDLDTGLLIYKNNSKRAETIVGIFGLNVRDQLVKERNDATEWVRAKLAKTLFGNKQAALEALQDLELVKSGELSHTLARRAQMRESRQRFPQI